MYRSGSTWLFNVVRLAMIHAGKAPLVLSSIDPESDAKFEASGNVILKTHIWKHSYQIADWIFASHRDLRDVVASHHRKFGSTPSIAVANEAFGRYLPFTFFSAYDMRYETMMSDQKAEMENIIRLIGLQCDSDNVLSELLALKFNKAMDGSEQDSVNFLHPGHITDGRHGSWKGIVPDAVVSEIETAHAAWLRENGYL